MAIDEPGRITRSTGISERIERTWRASPHFKVRDGGRPSYQLRAVDPGSFNNRRERRAYAKAARRAGHKDGAT